MVLIGIIGNIGSGKSTLAAYIEKKYHFVQKTFADPLKAACKKLFLLDDNQLDGTQIEKETPDPRWYGCSPRKMYQFVGTDLLRNQLDTIMPGLGTNVFTHHFRLWYEQAAYVNIVVSDVRFENEAKTIQDLGGVLIKIVRPDITNNSTHQSETELQNIHYDYSITNDKSLEDLYSKMDDFLRQFGMVHD